MLGYIYADDLIILSTSPVVLQNSLNKLSTYCNTWKLEIIKLNPSECTFLKMVRNPHIFFTNGHLLEEAAEYPYFGLNICNSGSFKAASKALTVKASKVLYNLKQLLYNSNLDPRISVKLFYQMIKPFYLHGTDICGPYTLVYHLIMSLLT